MRHPLTRVALMLAAAGSLAIGPASADPIGSGSGGMREMGYIFGALAVMVAAAMELLIVLVEALLYRWLLKLRFRQALLTSLCANVASLLTGFLLGSLGEAGIAIALAVEIPVVLALNPGYTKRVRMLGAVIGANVVTYGPLIALG